jgi:small subunit ribosomal protein S20
LAKHASALKQMRQGRKHRDRNRRSLSQLKSQIKRLRTVLSAGKSVGDDAKKLLAETAGEIDRAAKKGIIHDNAAARYKSRLSRRLNALSAPRT